MFAFRMPFFLAERRQNQLSLFSSQEGSSFIPAPPAHPAHLPKIHMGM